MSIFNLFLDKIIIFLKGVQEIVHTNVNNFTAILQNKHHLFYKHSKSYTILI